ncbi:MAG: hypothetical protein ABR559_05100 [Gemmatimonadota bacterium]
MRHRAVASVALLVLLFGALGVPCLAISRAQAQAPADHAGPCETPDAAATKILCAAPTLLASLRAPGAALPDPNLLAIPPVTAEAMANGPAFDIPAALRIHAPPGTAPPHYLLHSAFLI